MISTSQNRLVCAALLGCCALITACESDDAGDSGTTPPTSDSAVTPPSEDAAPAPDATTPGSDASGPSAMGGPAVEWSAGYGGEDTEEHSHFGIQTRDGGYVMVGEQSQGVRRRIFVVRTDASGTETFANLYGGTSADTINLGNFVHENTDGSLLVAGSWDTSTSGVDEDRAIMRLDSNGNLMGMQTFPNTSGRDAIEGLHVLDDGSIIAVGYRNADPVDRGTFIIDSGVGFIMRLTPDLRVAWERELPDFVHLFRVLPRTGASGFALFGACTDAGTGQTRFCMGFTDGEGRGGGAMLYGSTTSHPFDMDAAPGGGFILAGHAMQCAGGCWDGWLVRVDANGTELWNRTFGQPNGGTQELMYEECYGVRSVPAGGYVAACGTGIEPENVINPDDPLNTWRAHVIRVNEDGSLRWQQSYGDPGVNNAGEFVAATSDGGYAIFVDSDELGGSSNMGIFKLASDS